MHRNFNSCTAHACNLAITVTGARDVKSIKKNHIIIIIIYGHKIENEDKPGRASLCCAGQKNFRFFFKSYFYFRFMVLLAYPLLNKYNFQYRGVGWLQKYYSIKTTERAWSACNSCAVISLTICQKV